MATERLIGAGALKNEMDETTLAGRESESAPVPSSLPKLSRPQFSLPGNPASAETTRHRDSAPGGRTTRRMNMSETYYKLTDEYGCTRNEVQWGPGVSHSAEGEESRLCTSGCIHFYRDPLIAILMNPVHANFAKPRLWECVAEGEVIHEPLKSGARDGNNGQGNSGHGDHRGPGGPFCPVVRAGGRLPGDVSAPGLVNG